MALESNVESNIDMSDPVYDKICNNIYKTHPNTVLSIIDESTQGLHRCFGAYMSVAREDIDWKRCVVRTKTSFDRRLFVCVEPAMTHRMLRGGHVVEVNNLYDALAECAPGYIFAMLIGIPLPFQDVRELVRDLRANCTKYADVRVVAAGVREDLWVDPSVDDENLMWCWAPTYERVGPNFFFGSLLRSIEASLLRSKSFASLTMRGACLQLNVTYQERERSWPRYWLDVKSDLPPWRCLQRYLRFQRQCTICPPLGSIGGSWGTHPNRQSMQAFPACLLESANAQWMTSDAAILVSQKSQLLALGNSETSFSNENDAASSNSSGDRKFDQVWACWNAGHCWKLPDDDVEPNDDVGVDAGLFRALGSLLEGTNLYSSRGHALEVEQLLELSARALASRQSRLLLLIGIASDRSMSLLNELMSSVLSVLPPRVNGDWQSRLLLLFDDDIDDERKNSMLNEWQIVHHHHRLHLHRKVESLVDSSVLGDVIDIAKTSTTVIEVCRPLELNEIIGFIHNASNTFGQLILFLNFDHSSHVIDRIRERFLAVLDPRNVVLIGTRFECLPGSSLFDKFWIRLHDARTVFDSLQLARSDVANLIVAQIHRTSCELRRSLLRAHLQFVMTGWVMRKAIKWHRIVRPGTDSVIMPSLPPPPLDNKNVSEHHSTSSRSIVIVIVLITFFAVCLRCHWKN